MNYKLKQPDFDKLPKETNPYVYGDSIKFAYYGEFKVFGVSFNNLEWPGVSRT